MAEPSSSPDQNTITTITTTTTSPWGTLEELLLACAVHRYGTNSWDSIARELQNRTTSASFSLFTPHICQQKYRDLKRRFASDERNAGETSVDDASLWLDELRRLRVAELRRELQRYDLSIVSLQLKVKKLKEERDKNVKEEIKDETDLQQEKETEINEVKNEPPGEIEPVQVEPVKGEPDRVDEPAGEEDNSCNGSSNSKEERRVEDEKRERVDSAELVESVAESKDDGGGGGEREEGLKENSDVQSTASLWRSETINKNKNNGRREKKVVGFSGTSSGDENQSPAIKSNSEGKSQPLVEFLDIVRARKFGSFFERRLESQQSPDYTNLIRQHIDLGTVQRRLEEGQYTDCHTKFYRDLMLLIHNTTTFFAKKSSEYKAALELRQLLNKQFLSPPHVHKLNPSKPAQPAPLPKPTKPELNQVDRIDLKPKLTITGPVIACRKRSSISGKSSRGGERKEPSSATPPRDKDSVPLGEMVKQQGEKTSSASFNAVTKKRSRDQSFGSRSSSSKNNNNNNNSSNPSPSTPVLGKGESSEGKADKKKPSPGTSSSKMKQGSGSGKASFLESLKNSDKRKTGNDSNGSNVKIDKRKDEGSQNVPRSKIGKEKVGKGKEERESVVNRNITRPPKRAAAVAARGKRGRDSGGVAELQSKKRQRK